MTEKPLTILLVEDSDSDAYVLAKFFAEHPTPPLLHRVSNGDEAMDYIAGRGSFAGSGRPDMLLLDLSVPGISGYELLKFLKHDEQMAIPVIILSASRSFSDREECQNLGAAAFFCKPGDLQGYQALVQRLLAAHTTQA